MKYMDEKRGGGIKMGAFGKKIGDFFKNLF
jgi:hypothetical protein